MSHRTNQEDRMAAHHENKPGSKSGYDFRNSIVLKMTNEKYTSKPIDLGKERNAMKAFQKYLQADKTTENASRGLAYVLWRQPCDFMSAAEAFRVNAYDERESAVKLDKLRSERDRLQIEYRRLMAETTALQAKKIRYKRYMRQKSHDVNVTARSSGHPSNSYVYGYGYVYGVGYTDDEQTMTAPGFELTATEHVKRVIKKFSPEVGRGDFEKLYREIFQLPDRRPRKEPPRKHGFIYETTSNTDLEPQYFFNSSDNGLDF